MSKPALVDKKKKKTLVHLPAEEKKDRRKNESDDIKADQLSNAFLCPTHCQPYHFLARRIVNFNYGDKSQENCFFFFFFFPSKSCE